MAEITLADYTGYIFVEIVRARQMADDYSRKVAEVYAADNVLQHFSVPRFKVPKMELTIPVLISGAQFYETTRFNMAFLDFRAYIKGQIDDIVSSARASSGGPVPVPPVPVPPPAPEPEPDPELEPPLPPPGPLPPKPKPPLPPEPEPPWPGPDPWLLSAPRPAAMGVASYDDSTIDDLVVGFWRQLKENANPSQPADIVRDNWIWIFKRALADAKLVGTYNELYEKSLDNVLKKVVTNTVIDRTKLQNLFVNPETNVVKTGSSDTSVFTIKAEIQEEGFFLRSVKDESTGNTRTVVEFE